jgi:hypothetical protein
MTVEARLFVAFNAIMVGLLSAAASAGHLNRLLLDEVPIVLVLGVLSLIGVLFSWWRMACGEPWHVQERSAEGLRVWAEVMTAIAIAGTAIGFQWTFEHMTMEKGQVVQGLQSAMHGMGMALNNTIVGTVAWAWLMVNARLLDVRAAKR